MPEMTTNEPPVRLTAPPAAPRPARGTVRRQGHPGPGGPRSGSQAARACTSARPAWPACTTSSGRSSTTPSTRRWPALHTHHRHAAGRRRLPRRRQRPRHPGRPVPVRPAQGQERGRGRADRAARRRQVRRRGLQGVGWPARRRRQRRQRAVRAPRCSRSTATASATARSTPRAASRRARWRSSARRRHAVARAGHGDVLAGPDDLRRRGHRVRRPHRARAAADDGVPQPRPRDRPRRRAPGEGAEGHLPVQGRPRRLRQAPQRVQGGAVLEGLPLRGRRRGPPDPRHRHPVEHRLLRGHPRLRQRHLDDRGRHARRGLPHRPDDGRQQVRPGQGPAQGEGRQPPRRGHPRGHHGDHLGEAARPAVRGPDEGQARQRPDALVRPEGDQRAPRRVARGEPDRGQQGRQEGAGCCTGAGRGEERPQRDPPQDGALGCRHARQAEGLLEPQRRRERAVHRRGRLGGRYRRRCPRPADAGDPADPRQDPQRRAGPRRQDAEEQRDPGADHGDRRRGGRGVRRHQGPLPQGRSRSPTPTSTAATSARCC